MKIYHFILVFALLFISCQTNNELLFFDQIIGEWQLQNQPVIEKWEFKDGLYQSQVMMIRNSDTTITEKIRIIEKDGEYFYEATVMDHNNNSPVLFRIAESNENKVVFENPDHDFPNRITYVLINDKTINATIGGIRDGKNMEIEFNYSKINTVKPIRN